MKRRRITPIFTGSLQAWAFNYSRQNLWRVRPDLDMDDLMAEAALAFWRCVKAYILVEENKQAKNTKHFASLFHTAFANRVHRLAFKRSHRVMTLSSNNAEGEDLSDLRPTPADFADAEINLMLADAPAPVKKLVNLLVLHGESEQALIRLEHLAGKISVAGGHLNVPDKKESQNERLCRLVDENPQRINLAQMVLNWIAGSSDYSRHCLIPGK